MYLFVAGEDLTFQQRHNSFLLLILGLMTSSCTVAPQEPAYDLESLGDKVSFAYDADVDQIAYMSCADMSSSSAGGGSGAYFTFRVGAYRDGGLKLRDSFNDQTKRMRPQDRDVILAYSKENMSAVPQLSVRKRDDLRAVFVDTTAVEGRDYDNFFTPIGNGDPIDKFLANANDRIRYTRTNDVRGARFEASISFRSKSAIAEQLRTSLSSDFLLTLTFGNFGKNSGTTLPRTAEELEEDSALRSAFGIGLNIGFQQPKEIVNGNFPNYVLRGPANPSENVEGPSERNLENLGLPSGKGKWICPPELQYRIVRREDLAAVNASAPSNIKPCRILYDEQENPGLLSRRLARLSLRAEDWYMDSQNQCIVSKRSEQGCYGTTTSVEYNLKNTCNPAGGANACVHFASICYRVDN